MNHIEILYFPAFTVDEYVGFMGVFCRSTENGMLYWVTTYSVHHDHKERVLQYLIHHRYTLLLLGSVFKVIILLCNR